MFFAHNIPDTAPTYLEISARPRFTAIAQRVIRRMDLLESALMLSGMRGEEFSVAVQPFFQHVDRNGWPLIDSMTDVDLAEIAIRVHPAIAAMDIPDRMEWPNCKTVVDTAFVLNKEWECLRMLGIGGSDSACIMDEGYSPAIKIYHGKIGSDFVLQEAKDPGLEYIFSYGHKVEPLVIEEFCRRTGATPIHETRMFCHKDYPFLTANIDQIVRFPDGRIFVFEAKTTTEWNKDSWEDEHIPRQYIPQCRKYPLVLNDDRICGTFIGCIYGNTPDQFQCSFLDRDPGEEQAQLEREVRFWQDHVLAGVEPPMPMQEDKAAAFSKLKAGKAEETAPVVEFDPDEFASSMLLYTELAAEIVAEKKKIEAIQSRMVLISADVINKMGSAVYGICPCPQVMAPDAETEYAFDISFKPRKKTSCDTKRLQLMYPQAYRDCVTVDKNGSRTFNMKLKKAKSIKRP